MAMLNNQMVYKLSGKIIITDIYEIIITKLEIGWF